MEFAKSVLDGCFTSDASANNAGSRNKPSFILLQLFLSATILSAKILSAATVLSLLVPLDSFSLYLYE